MKKIDLRNKKILYIGPVFFYYDQYLINKLKELGAVIDPFELYLKSLRFKFIKKFNISEIEAYKQNYYDQVLLKNNYDYVLVRHGHQLSSEFYKRLRKINPNASFINFHWDSIKPQYDYRSTINCFDKVFSFDYKDCQTYDSQIPSFILYR